MKAQQAARAAMERELMAHTRVDAALKRREKRHRYGSDATRNTLTETHTQEWKLHRSFCNGKGHGGPGAALGDASVLHLSILSTSWMGSTRPQLYLALCPPPWLLGHDMPHLCHLGDGLPQMGYYRGGKGGRGSTTGGACGVLWMPCKFDVPPRSA